MKTYLYVDFNLYTLDFFINFTIIEIHISNNDFMKGEKKMDTEILDVTDFDVREYVAQVNSSEHESYMVPTLKLEDEVETSIPQNQEVTTANMTSSTVLSPEEQKMVDDFAKTINLTNTNQILQYGASAQKRMADFSDAALDTVRTKDFGEVGDLLSGVVGELKSVDYDRPGGFLSFLKTPAQKLEIFKAQFAKAETNLDKVSDTLRGHEIRLLKDSAILERMYDQNLVYFKELTMYIMAGTKKLEETRATTLVELEDVAKRTGLAEDVQAARDLADKCDRFEKKIHDLKLTRQIAIQTAPQIRLIQNNNNIMVEKIQTTLVNTIPLWKQQMILALGITHANEAAAAQRMVSDVTNELLKQNAAKLRLASVETAKESERGIVDVETLKKTNAELIATLDDVLKIQSEGRKQRQAAEADMLKLENQLKEKLLVLSSPK